MLRQVYKVCNYEPLTDRLTSTYASMLSVGVEYAIGVRTVPKYGKLFAFDTLSQAKGFAGAWFQRRIYLANAEVDWYIKSIITEGEMLFSLTVDKLFGGGLYSVQGVRNMLVSEKMNVTLRPAPEGSLACDWIELVERVA